MNTKNIKTIFIGSLLSLVATSTQMDAHFGRGVRYEKEGAPTIIIAGDWHIESKNLSKILGRFQNQDQVCPKISFRSVPLITICPLGSKKIGCIHK